MGTLLNPVTKRAADERIALAELVPTQLGQWLGQTFDTADYSDQWQSINELLVRNYSRGFRFALTEVLFILEYSSDVRRNFSFHFPENCHRASGNKIDFLPDLAVELEPGKILRAKFFYIRGIPGSQIETDKVIAYWLCLDKKQYYKTFWIKIDQALAGLLKQSKRGFLVRFDYGEDTTYDPQHIVAGQQAISAFIKDFYAALPPETRELLFGEKLRVMITGCFLYQI